MNNIGVATSLTRKICTPILVNAKPQMMSKLIKQIQFIITIIIYFMILFSFIYWAEDKGYVLPDFRIK